jgi:diguanylate cyclase (GGDEF)-like protein
MGDRALRLFARTLSRSLPSDALIARYGGEEFVVVLPNINAAQAARCIDVVRADLEAALADGRVPAFTVSAGVVDNTEVNATTLDELVDTADGWLLQAKSAGRNRVLGGQTNDNVIELADKVHD